MTRRSGIIKDEYGGGYEDGTSDYQTLIMELPSAEPKWIPFRQELNPDTNRYEWVDPLPQDREHILISVEMEGHEPVQDDYFYLDANDCHLDSGYTMSVEATAWMPLPPAYKEGESE